MPHGRPRKSSSAATDGPTLPARAFCRVVVRISRPPELTSWMAWLISSRLTRYRIVGLQSTAFYWHAVNVITLVVLVVQLSTHL